MALLGACRLHDDVYRFGQEETCVHGSQNEVIAAHISLDVHVYVFNVCTKFQLIWISGRAVVANDDGISGLVQKLST